MHPIFGTPELKEQEPALQFVKAYALQHGFIIEVYRQEITHESTIKVDGQQEYKIKPGIQMKMKCRNTHLPGIKAKYCSWFLPFGTNEIDPEVLALEYEYARLCIHEFQKHTAYEKSSLA